MKICALIPSYNHHQKVPAICRALFDLQLPVILVDDASDQVSAESLTLVAADDRICLVRHATNQGKGGAVMTGIRKAHELGYSHVLQVDADGQHALEDIPRMLEQARRYPQQVISGQPSYDASIPKGRKYGRYITHFWVWVETLSFSIRDAMCGFRVYPVSPCLKLMEDKTLGRRMDFDIEILVRLYWRKVPTRFVRTRVTYPQDGSSHFQPLQDNLRISWLHTRLFFGMLWRAPVLLGRKLLP